MGAGQSLEDHQAQASFKAKTKMTETACFDFRQEVRRHSDDGLLAARGTKGGGFKWDGDQWGNATQNRVPQFRLGSEWGGGDNSSNVSRDTSRDTSRKTSDQILEDHHIFLPSSGRSSNRSSNSSTISNFSSSSSENQFSSLMMVPGDDGFVDLTSGVQSWSRKKTEKRNSFKEKHGLWAGEGEPIQKYKKTFFNS